MTTPFDRAATLTKNLKLEKQGLEIGPLFRPIVPKKGTGVLYADHLPTDMLRDKYRSDERVRNDQIQDVDIVVGPSGIGDAVGSRRFNYVLASHVIEHIPNPLEWFNEIYGFMEPGEFSPLQYQINVFVLTGYADSPPQPIGLVHGCRKQQSQHPYRFWTSYLMKYAIMAT